MKQFEELRKSMQSLDRQREEIISLSREIVRLSKQIIYSAHREDMKKAASLMQNIRKKISEIKKYPHRDDFAGSLRIAFQEYVEAACFVSYLEKKDIPTAEELKVEPEHYLLGICDLTGEFVRKAINTAVKGNYEQALAIKDFVTNLYGELLMFDFRNNELRKKFDGVKYDLRKLEDLSFEIKMKSG